MRRALLVMSVLVIGLSPAVAQATHIEYPTIQSDCQQFEIGFKAKYRSAVTSATLQLVVTIVDEAGVEKLRFTTEEQLELTGEQMVHYDYDWIWNDVTDDYIHLIGLVTVRAELTIVAPWLTDREEERIDVHTVEVETNMVCDVVSDDDTSWGAIKSLYR